MSIISQNKIHRYFASCACCVPHVPVSSPRYSMSISSCMFHKDPIVHLKGTFTLCPFQYQSPCQSPCPCLMKTQFIRKSEVLFRLHQFPYPYPNQCHRIPVRSVSIGPPTVKNWYGRPILSVSGPETCTVAMHSGILVYFSRERTPPRSWQINIWCIQKSLHWLQIYSPHRSESACHVTQDQQIFRQYLRKCFKWSNCLTPAAKKIFHVLLNNWRQVFWRPK